MSSAYSSRLNIGLFGNSRFSPSVSLSGLWDVHLFLRSETNLERSDSRVIYQRKTLSIVDSLSRTFSIPSVLSPYCQIFYYHIGCMSLGKLMATCGSLSSRAILGAQYLEILTLKNGQRSNFMTQTNLFHSSKSYEYSGKVSGCLKNREPCGSNLVFGYFSLDAIGRYYKSNPFVGPGAKHCNNLSSAECSAGAAPDVSLNQSTSEEKCEDPAVSSDKNYLGERILKLFSGSCYLPHPDKEETGGEDAHFICIDEQAVGVADGVGGWAELGVDAGQYARELMSHSVSAIQDEPKGSIDSARVLEKAHSSTKAKGSSTACIIALTDQGIHAVNIGDSGFIVVREGKSIFRSPVQQHGFNFPYQLENGYGSDPPSAAQVFTFPVAPGDVIVAGTDGLFDNVFNDELTEIVADAVRSGLGPQVTAQKIVSIAHQRAQDKYGQTPFSSAAREAGFQYYGGKLDDITVVVSYIASSDG